MPVRSESAQVMRISFFDREEVIRLALVEHTAVDTIHAIKPSAVDLDDHDKWLLEGFEQDLQQRPILSIFGRKGCYTFVITDDNVYATLKSHRQHRLRSHIQFDSQNELLALERLERALKVACNQMNVELVGIQPVAPPHKGFIYKVTY